MAGSDSPSSPIEPPFNSDEDDREELVEHGYLPPWTNPPHPTPTRNRRAGT